MDPLEGWWLPPQELAAAIKTITKYRPDTLVLSEYDFSRLVNACLIHTYGHWLRTEYLKLGINTVIFNEEAPEDTYDLSSGYLADGRHVREAIELDRLEFLPLETPIARTLLPATPGVRFSGRR